MRQLGLYRIWRAALMLAVCILVSAIGAAAIRQLSYPLLMKAYSHRFSFVPGHRFGEGLTQITDSSSDVCVVIGASNAREGFEPAAIEASIPELDVVNAATTGGNNEVLEIQSAIMEQHGLEPRCVIAGVSTWMMFRDGTPSITAEEYLGLMEWDTVIALAARPMLTEEAPRVVAGLVLPLRSQASQLNRVIRSSVRDARAASIGSLPISRYETFDGELRPADEYLYLKTPSHLLEDWDKLVERSKPWYPAGRYGGALQERSLRKSLDQLLAISNDVVLVITPQTPILAPASQSGAPHFWRALESYRDRISIIDCSGFRDFSLFIDEGHLNAIGRQSMSAEVGQILRTVLSGQPQIPTRHCRLLTD